MQLVKIFSLVVRVALVKRCPPQENRVTGVLRVVQMRN